MDDAWVCVDCAIALANDDYSAIESEDRAETVRAGVRDLGPCAVGGDTHELSGLSCDCCGTARAGSRYGIVLIGDSG
jgi:hypothetical protein